MKEQIEKLQAIVDLYYILLCPEWMKEEKIKASQQLLTLKLEHGISNIKND